ncbi:LysR family transcriptional regulator [Cohnella kolymensis]|uniref:LysR family transcriptional regulator n=1 Tax=Cohnella kolymensis TaxID=1590652 RepID=A0ABR5A406_9BACL|nr:LysR substrate-binding domain-containing protein [Cohnella kolymensis]KIL35764.1 LysR family transcriptional regulator [Cohnella kolymensis]
MTIAKFEVFNTVIELGSLTKAAEALHLTQSGVSHAIASLETEMGFPLLIRGRSGISLTCDGERILKYIRDILQKNEQIKQEAAIIKGLEIGTVRVGTFPSVSIQWLPGILKEFQAQHPSIEIRLLEGNYDEVERWILNGDVDFGFISLPTAAPFETIPLKKDRMLCIMPQGHALSEKQTIRIEDICEESFIMPKDGCDNDVRRMFREAGVKPNIRFEMALDQAIIAMVANGLGVSILPEMILAGTANHVHMASFDQDSYRSLALASVSFKQMSPASKRFIGCVKAWVVDLLQ